MEKSSILFLSLLILPFLGFTQGKVNCNSKAVQDSLVEAYSEKAWQFGYNHPSWGVCWDSLLAICPNISDAYHEKSIPYLKSGDYARAFELEDKAVDIDPKKWLAYRGFLHCIFTKNYDKALTDFANAENLVPGAFVMDHTYSFYCGLSYLESGEYRKAEQAFMRDIAQQKKGEGKNDIHFNTMLYLGIVYYELKEYDLAEKSLRECRLLYPQLPEANYYLGKILKDQKKTSAGYYFERAKEFHEFGYNLNEDNEVYVNYPRQVSMREIEKELEY